MGRADHVVVELRVGSIAEDELAVRRVTGREALSEPFAFDVELEPRAGEPLELEDLVGADALLTVRRPDGTERHVHGVAWSAELRGVSAGHPSYRVRIAPRLARLGHVRRSRIFQGLSVPEIVARVLDEGGVRFRDALAGAHPAREHCVQYRESDLAFVSRLLEEAGIFYWFEHGADGHVLVLADDGGGCAALPGEAAVPFRLPDAVSQGAGEEHVFRVSRSQRVEPGKVSLKDFDFERPELDVSGASADAADAEGLEWYEHPARSIDPAALRRLARTRLEALRVPSETFAGEGTCIRFAPGARFELVEHHDGVFDRELLLVAVEHRATQQERPGEDVERTYRNRFTALDATRPYRPRRRAPRPVAWAETATVVGPAGEEVHTDAHGRVKVQFHWDREGRRDETSSCWIRPAQAWAGPGWGASFVPRIGQEVLVRFLDGDPDRPLLAGAVYNGQNPTPVALPDEKTKSTLRSSSSPGGDGANELRFEDAAGAEEIHLHAQKDEAIEVLNDKAQRVAGAESLEVEKDRSVVVHGAQRLQVALDDETAIDGRRTVTVAGARGTAVVGSSSAEVGGSRSVTVAGSRHVAVADAASETVGAAAALSVGGAYAVSVAGAVNHAVGGAKATQVAGERLELVGATRDETVVKDSVAKTGGDLQGDVAGGVARSTGKDHTEQAGGKAEVEVKEAVAWLAKSFELTADKLSLVVGGKLVLSVDKGGNVKFAASSFTADGSAVAVKGKQVKVAAGAGAGSGSASVAQLQSRSDPRAAVQFTLTDQDGNPVANEPFRVELPDGTVIEGATDGSGGASVPGSKPGNAKVTFPRRAEGAVRKK